MKQIDIVFVLDESTGDLHVDVEGHQGHACVDDVLAAVEEMLGASTKTFLKQEYHQGAKDTVRRTVKGRQG